MGGNWVGSSLELSFRGMLLERGWGFSGHGMLHLALNIGLVWIWA